MAEIDKDYLKTHKSFRIRNKNTIAIFPLIAVLVAISVFWCLKLIGITVVEKQGEDDETTAAEASEEATVDSSVMEITEE